MNVSKLKKQAVQEKVKLDLLSVIKFCLKKSQPSGKPEKMNVSKLKNSQLN